MLRIGERLLLGDCFCVFKVWDRGVTFVMKYQRVAVESCLLSPGLLQNICVVVAIAD
jgi:hypothetical protein